MALTALTLAHALECAANEAETLARFINDLDGWDGSDCDTGTNAAITLRAMSDALAPMTERTPFALGLEAAVEAGIDQGQGHIGVILTAMFSAWLRAVDHSADLTPIAVRRMLKSEIRSDADRLDLSDSISRIFDFAAESIEGLGDTLSSAAYVVSWYSLSSQEALTSETNERTGRIDAGASVLALVFACFDTTISEDPGPLQTLANMLSDLSGGVEAGEGPRPSAPAPGRAFAVDCVWEGIADDAADLFASIEALGSRLSATGLVDPFGVGRWRLHIDTSAPIAVRPRTGRIIRFVVIDARSDEELGVDELADEGITHRGVRLLERRPRKRVDRVRVLACTRAPGLVEDLARTGAVVLLDPLPEDGADLARLATASTTGVALFVPCDDASAALATALARTTGARNGKDEGEAAPGNVLLVADTRDELSGYHVAAACAGLFVPQPGGREAAPTVVAVLTQAARAALAASRVAVIPVDPEIRQITAAHAEVTTFTTRHWRVLLGRSEGPELLAVLRELIPDSIFYETQLDVIDGGQEGPSLLQGLSA